MVRILSHKLTILISFLTVQSLSFLAFIIFGIYFIYGGLILFRTSKSFVAAT